MSPAADAIRILIADDHLLFRSGDVALRGGVPAGARNRAGRWPPLPELTCRSLSVAEYEVRKHETVHVTLGAQLQATLTIIPAHTWYAAPSGALTFVNERGANYLGLPSDHPLEEALRASGGRVFGPSGAAARLGIARSTLESKIRALGINKNRFRGRPPKP